MTDQLLETLINEIRGLRQDIKSTGVDTCGTRDALIMLGVNNARILTYFHREGLLTRRGGRKGGCVYYKSELLALSASIRQGSVVIPKLNEI